MTNKKVFIKRISLIFFLNIIFIVTYSQNQYSWKMPVDIPIFLSGNFGEIRSTHFHAGIDIKTQGKEGHNIFSIAKGYVSRIKISPTGYGNAIYISHPNGITSVYGHCKTFVENIDNWILEQQYKNQEFAIDLFPDSSLFKIKSGEKIATSGNTGSSMGPHLHFEIRKTAGSIPLNALNNGFDVADHIPPKLYSLFVYPQSKSSFVENSNYKLEFPLIKSKNYKLESLKRIEAYGEIAFGVYAIEYLDGSNNKCGVFEIEMSCNGEKIYSHKIDEFKFSETSYIRSFMDYDEKIRSSRNVQRLFIEPNNKMSIYSDVKNNGIVEIEEGKKYNFEILLFDVKANVSKLNFEIVGKIPDEMILDSTLNDYTKAMPYQIENRYSTDDFEIIVPRNALFDNLFFHYSVEVGDPNAISRTHHIHNKYTAVNKAFKIRIKPTKSIENPEKLYIEKIDIDDADVKFSLGGKLVNEMIETRTKEFGVFRLALDTVPPVVEALSFSPDNQLEGEDEILFRIWDDESGISEYNAWVDEKWILMRYDPKTKRLFHKLSDGVIQENSEHNLVLEIKDVKENINRMEISFYY